MSPRYCNGFLRERGEVSKNRIDSILQRYREWKTIFVVLVRLYVVIALVGNKKNSIGCGQ